jgi:ferric-dicitrate binding protein FerR (iron transport regulator)
MPGKVQWENSWKDLIEKYISNTCSREELKQLLQIIETQRGREELTTILKNQWDNSNALSTEDDLELKFRSLMQNLKHEAPVVSIIKKNKARQWKTRIAAAVLIGTFSVGAYLVWKPDHKHTVAKTETGTLENNHDIAAGGNKAILTLADGSTVVLDNAKKGILSTQGGTKVLKLNNGLLSYDGDSKTNTLLFNTISTPRGGQYQLILADGTKVWLNAASSLKFPTAFAGKERKVELLGEAYFEVAKNVSMPFKVEVDGMEVEVLGTHFNINSYDDEAATRTTLLEGSIQINKNNRSSLLRPGQQAKLNRDGEIKIINHADVEEAIAWKEPKVQNDRADIHNVKRQISRWYDVEVQFKGIIPKHFGGTISRSVNLSKVLNMLEMTGEVKFRVEDHKVLVIPTK